MDKKDMKITALLERVSALTQEYENKVADLRVELTVSDNARREAEQRLADSQSPDVKYDGALEGEIV